jgi:hypothetical protein
MGAAGLFEIFHLSLTFRRRPNRRHSSDGGYLFNR